MSALGGAVELLGSAIRHLENAAADTGGWRDAQRAALERSRLQPMALDARRLLSQLEQAARDISSAQSRLNI